MSKPDQDDILAQLETLRREQATATANVAKLTTDLAAANALAARVPNLEANIEAVTQERDTLKAENTRLSGESRDFNARVSAELAKLGIRKEGAEAPKREAAAGEGSDAEGLVAQFNAITDHGERAKFLAKHADKLRQLVTGAR